MKKDVEKLYQKSEKRGKTYPHRKMWKYRKKWVIHQVIHFIHGNDDKNIGLHSKKYEQMFCEEIIKLITDRKRMKKVLTFQKWKTIKIKA